MSSNDALFVRHAQVCQMLGHPRRLEIINALRDGEMAAGELAVSLGISKANLSQHLALMQQRGVVVSRREGLHVYYRIANPKIMQACDLMRQVLLDQLTVMGSLAEQAQAAATRSS